jgi:agmatine deiminase
MTSVRMPAETDRHERTLLAWPTQVRRRDLWGDALEAARNDTALIASTIAHFEPVLLIADPGEADDARGRVSADVEVVALPIDDSWLRDSGPIFVFTADGERRGKHFGFNGWGNKFAPIAHDQQIGARISEHLGIPYDDVPMVLEGGSIAVDGNGLLVTTERCLLNPNRNPGLSRAEIEAVLSTHLGASRVVWLADGIAEDDGTDGHVDNVVAFFAPGRALLQGCDDVRNPNHAIAADNRQRLEAAGIDVVEVPHLPYTTASAAAGSVRGPAGSSLVAGEPKRLGEVPVPYVNVYACNGAVIVPTAGTERDDDMLTLIGNCYPTRDVIAVPGAVLAYGGGGVHCITQQVPAPPS